jgi:hypothetical protein
MMQAFRTKRAASRHKLLLTSLSRTSPLGLGSATLFCLRAGQQSEMKAANRMLDTASTPNSFMWHDEQIKLSIVLSAKRLLKLEKLDHRRKPQPKFFPFG